MSTKNKLWHDAQPLKLLESTNRFLPLDNKKRKIIYNRALKHKKELHFILDEMVFNRIEMIEKIENYLIFRNEFFTNTKNKTNNFEKNLANSSKVSFV